MTWISGSALFYVAMAKDSDGVIHSCNSMDVTCKIEGLKCSTNYTAYVIATNFMCNSSASEMVTIETGTVRLLVFPHQKYFTIKLEMYQMEALCQCFGFGVFVLFCFLTVPLPYFSCLPTGSCHCLPGLCSQWGSDFVAWRAQNELLHCYHCGWRSKTS